MKRQSAEWEKIFANDMNDKGLISNIHEPFRQLNSKKSKSDYKIGRAFEQMFF